MDVQDKSWTEDEMTLNFFYLYWVDNVGQTL
jgi:hypothetical protein